MFKKINAVFKPNRTSRAREDYHSACTVRLVRSASMLTLSERSRVQWESTLKRSASAVTLQSGTALFYYHSREERVWLYSQNQECLQYLQELVELRRRYTKSVSNVKHSERKEEASSKKKPAPQPPLRRDAQPVRVQPSAPQVPSEEETLQFFDAVIASCDSERTRKPVVDDGHEDVDYVVATSTCQHDLHSNWVLRDPRRTSVNEPRLKQTDLGKDKNAWRKAAGGTTSGTRCLQRNPIHLPKVVESALQTLRFKTKVKKKD